MRCFWLCRYVVVAGILAFKIWCYYTSYFACPYLAKNALCEDSQRAFAYFMRWIVADGDRQQGCSLTCQELAAFGNLGVHTEAVNKACGDFIPLHRGFDAVGQAVRPSSITATRISAITF